MCNAEFTITSCAFCSHGIFMFSLLLLCNKQRLFPNTAVKDWFLYSRSLAVTVEGTSVIEQLATCTRAAMVVWRHPEDLLVCSIGESRRYPWHPCSILTSF